MRVSPVRYSCTLSLSPRALALVGSGPSAVAQEATPGERDDSRPAADRARPRQVRGRAARVGRDPRDLRRSQRRGLGGHAGGFVELAGEPADAATIAAVTEVVEVIRCNANGGNGLADAYYLTDEHLRGRT